MSGNEDFEAPSNIATSHLLPTTPNGNTNLLQPPDSHPIIAAMREHEMGKATLGIAILFIVQTFFQKSATLLGLELTIIQMLLATGCVAIWNGIMLEKTYPKAASLLEQVGIALVFLAFSVLLASNTPVGFMWFPPLCFILLILPLIMAALPHEAAA